MNVSITVLSWSIVLSASMIALAGCAEGRSELDYTQRDLLEWIPPHARGIYPIGHDYWRFTLEMDGIDCTFIAHVMDIGVVDVDVIECV